MYLPPDLDLVACYLLLVGMVYVLLLAVGIVLVGIWSLIRPLRRLATFGRRAGRLTLFLLCLYLTGAVSGMIWGATIWNRLYYSTDYCAMDFLPFCPITPGIIDAPFGNEHGHLKGVSLFQLNLVWLAFALATWAGAAGLFKLSLRGLDRLHRSPHRPIWRDNSAG